MENDESANRLSLEKTASTVQIASTTVERTTSKAGPETTGRTAWDAIVDVLGMLGRYTPWIIIFAGGCYGFYKFRELQQHAQKDAQDAAQSQIDQAHKDLRDTYEQIGKMHQQQLEGLSSMLSLNQKTTESTKQQQTELNALRDEAKKIQGEAEEAKKAVAKAKSDALAAEKEKADAQRQREEEDSKHGKRAREFADKEKELARQEAAVKQRSAHITELRDKLSILARHMVDSKDPSIATLGRDIQKESSLEAEKLLAAYSKQPGTKTAEPLQELVGASEETLEAMLPKGLGFAFWQRYSMKDGTDTAYLGVVRQTADTDEGVVSLTMTGKKVENVDVFPLIVSVALWAPGDWNKSIAYNLYLRPDGEVGIDPFDIQRDFWTVPDIYTEYHSEGPPKKIFGVEKPLYFMKLEDFKKRTDIFKAARTSDREGFSNMVAMLENEKTFDATKIAQPYAEQMPKGMRETFVQLLTESVKRAKVKSVEIASPSNLKPEVHGLIAAAALKPDFRIEEVELTPALSASSTKKEIYFIRCAYRPVDEPIKHARLTFVREGSNGKWMLQNFENPFAPSLAKAE